jgi:uncharacterized damage-inducible protein DinB
MSDQKTKLLDLFLMSLLWSIFWTYIFRDIQFATRINTKQIRKRSRDRGAKKQMGFDTLGETMDAMRLTPELLANAVRSLTLEQVRKQPAEGEWSILEVICHLRDIEEVALNRFRAIRDQDDAVVTGADASALARAGNYIADDPARALAAFTEKRATHVAELKALQPDQWQRTGRHVTNGPLSILNNSLHATWHDTNHLAQIARLLP